MRFIGKLDEKEKLSLMQYLSDSSLIERERKRFTMIMLSSAHHLKIKEIAQSCGCSENTVKTVFNTYESAGFQGLLDKNMSHSKSSLSVFAPDKIMDCVAQSPQNLKQVVALLAEQQDIQTTKGILQNYLKKKSGLGTELENL